MDKNLPDNIETKNIYKVVVVGDTNVGKTNILKRFIENNLPISSVPTIGIEFYIKAIKLKNDKIMKIQFWDTAGQERYQSLTSSHYKNASGALLVYDITKQQTFKSIHKWIEEIRNQCGQEIKLMLLGNKLDLIENGQNLRKVNKDEAEQFAIRNQMLFEEVSALTSNNVDDAFQKLFEEISKIEIQDQDININIKQNQKDQQNQNTSRRCLC